MVLCRGDGVLQSFISSRDAKGLQEYIKKGFNINQVNKYGESPIYVASYYGEDSIVDFLLENGANPNICNCDGDTPLHAAAFGGFSSILEKLILNGGDLRLANYQGQRARDLLVYSESSSDNVDSLIKHYFNIAEYISCGGDVDSVFQNWKGKCNQSRRSKSKFIPACSDFRADSLTNRQGNLLSQHCIIHTGFGVFSCKNNKAVGYAAHIPIINNEIDLKPDRGAVDVYCNGAFTEIVSMQWRGTPVSVKRVDAQAILNEDCDAPLIGLLFNQPLREIEFMSYLRHPNILTLMAVSPIYYPQNSDVSLSLVFERAHLGSLYHHIHVKLEELDLLTGLTIMRQITEAVMFLHDSNLVHCALTSHAIHLIAPDFAKLGNLEYAIERPPNSRSTLNKEFVYPSGKYSCSLPARNTLPQAVYNWLAPELFQSDVPITVATDVYSMGVLVWEILTGVMPHKHSLPEEIFRNWTPAVSPSAVDCETVPSGLRSSLRGTQHHHPKARITLEQLYRALVSTFWNEYDRFTYSPRSVSHTKQDFSDDRNDSHSSNHTLMNISPLKKPKFQQLTNKITTQALIHQVHHNPEKHITSQTNNSNKLFESAGQTKSKSKNRYVPDQKFSQQNLNKQEMVGTRSEDKENSESEFWVTTLDESDVLTVSSRKKMERQFSSVSSSSSVHPTTTTTNNEDSPNKRQAVMGKPPINNPAYLRSNSSMAGNIERMPPLKQNKFNRETYKQFAAVPTHSGNGRLGRATYPRRRDTIDNCSAGYSSTQSSRSRHSSEEEYRVKPASHRTSVSPPRAARCSESVCRPIDLIKVSSRGMRSPSPPFATSRDIRDDPAWQRHKPVRGGSLCLPIRPAAYLHESRDINQERSRIQEGHTQRGEVVEEPLAKVKTLVSSFEDLDRQSLENKQSQSRNRIRRSYEPAQSLNRTASLSPIMRDNKFVGAINSILQSKHDCINRAAQSETETTQANSRHKVDTSTGINFKAVQEKWRSTTRDDKHSTKNDKEFLTAREVYNEDAMKAGFTSANQVLKQTLKSGSNSAKASFNTAKELYNRVAKKAHVQLAGENLITNKVALSAIVDESVNSPEMASTPVYANTNKAEEFRYVSSSSGPDNIDAGNVNESKSDNDEHWTTAFVETIDISSNSSVVDKDSHVMHNDNRESKEIRADDRACIEAVSQPSSNKIDQVESHVSHPPISCERHNSKCDSEVYLPYCGQMCDNKKPTKDAKTQSENAFISSSDANVSDIEPRTVIKKPQPQWFHRRHTRRITKIRSRPLVSKEFDSGSGRNTWDELDPSDIWSDDERWREALYSENFWELGVKWPDKENRNDSTFARSDYRSCDNIFDVSRSTSSVHKSTDASEVHQQNYRIQPFRDLNQVSQNKRKSEMHSADVYRKDRHGYSQESLNSGLKEDRENRSHASSNASLNFSRGIPSGQFVTPASGASDEDWGF